MSREVRYLLCIIVALLASDRATASEAKANLKALYTAEKAYALPGHEVHFSFFDVFADFDVPPSGGQANGFFDVFTEISVDGGGFLPLQGSGQLVHRNLMPDHLDGEILSMSLASGPSGPLFIRESPTLPSLGQTKLVVEGGQTRIDSFFDVFVDLSLDGGASWLPLTPEIRLQTVPEPATLASLALGVAVAACAAWRGKRRNRGART